MMIFILIPIKVSNCLSDDVDVGTLSTVLVASASFENALSLGLALERLVDSKFDKHTRYVSENLADLSSGSI